MSTPTNPTRRLYALIHQLGHHKPKNRQLSGEASAEDDQCKGVSLPAFPSSIHLPSECFHSKRAAVLVCLFVGAKGDIRVILTKRSSKLSTHSGEVSFPGGMVEVGDADYRETAIREAKEEIGLDPSVVAVVAILEPFLSQHLYPVVPVIGVLTDKKAFIPVLDAAEVETIFDAPLEMFLKDENHILEEHVLLCKKYTMHYFGYETNNKKFVIWGLTSSILIYAASLVYQRQPSFPGTKPDYTYYIRSRA